MHTNADGLYDGYEYEAGYPLWDPAYDRTDFDYDMWTRMELEVRL